MTYRAPFVQTAYSHGASTATSAMRIGPGKLARMPHPAHAMASAYVRTTTTTGCGHRSTLGMHAPFGFSVGVVSVAIGAAACVIPRTEQHSIPQPRIPLAPPFRLGTRTVLGPYLHILFRWLLLSGRQKVALQVLRVAALLPFFVSTLEHVLCDAMEGAYRMSRDLGGASSNTDSLLHRAMALLQGCKLSMYTRVLLAVARKSDRAWWPVFVACLGDPGRIFERCLAAAMATSNRTAKALRRFTISSAGAIASGTKLLHSATNFMLLLHEQSGESGNRQALRNLARLSDATMTLLIAAERAGHVHTSTNTLLHNLDELRNYHMRLLVAYY